MARGTGKSPLVVISDARGTHKPAKSRFVGTCFFQSIFGVEKGGGEREQKLVPEFIAKRGIDI